MGIRRAAYVSKTCINQIDIQKMFIFVPSTLEITFPWDAEASQHEKGRKQLPSQLPLVIKPMPG